MIPKFRAWHKKEKAMYYLDDKDMAIEFWQDGNWYLIRWGDDGNTYANNDNSILMQSTGLKDKNSKEIFEGDLVKYEDCILHIKWGSTAFYYEIVKQKNKNVVHDIRMYRAGDEWKVIGNIYENPELIKEGE